MPDCRSREASENTVIEIRKLDQPSALEAVKCFRSRKRFIRGTKGRDLRLQVLVENIETGQTIPTTALLDSGATGSCVNRAFVDKHRLMVKPLPVKMPVYNADGTLNEGGSVEGYAEVRMMIGEHAERIELAVTNLGKTDIFLGLDWLRYHNPTIDWNESLLVFDRCPDRCGYIPFFDSPEDNGSRERLHPGEQLFMFDWDGYIKGHGHFQI